MGNIVFYNIHRKLNVFKEYKMLWSERCDADWPCKIHVKNKCGALLHHFHNGKWKKLALKKELVRAYCIGLFFILCFFDAKNHFGSFKLPSIKNEISIQLYSVDVPPGIKFKSSLNIN